uniref:Dynein light chain roadblock n=1 Tax=Romanomermis culicivorax TaxID=13658 RepID=A0A915ISY8_ROMCU
MSVEVEETIKRLQNNKGVVGVLVTDFEGHVIKSTFTNPDTTGHYAALLFQLMEKSKSTIRDMDPIDDLTFLRLRSKKHEILVAPDKEYMLAVIQNLTNP